MYMKCLLMPHWVCFCVKWSPWRIKECIKTTFVRPPVSITYFTNNWMPVHNWMPIRGYNLASDFTRNFKSCIAFHFTQTSVKNPPYISIYPPSYISTPIHIICPNQEYTLPFSVQLSKIWCNLFFLSVRWIVSSNNVRQIFCHKNITIHIYVAVE